MSQKQHHPPNVTTSTRTVGNASLMDNPFELLDQAHHLLVQAEELLRKDENPMALDIHRVVGTLLAITLKAPQQRHEKLPHLKQHIRYVYRERPVVASRPQVNSKSVQRKTSIFTAGDEHTLTEWSQLQSQKKLSYSNLSSSFGDRHLSNDTDNDSTSLSNFETFFKKRKPVKKSEVTSSWKLNASGTEKCAKKKRRDTGTEKQLKTQLDSVQGPKSKIEVSLPVSSSISKKSCHQKEKNSQQKENQFSFEPPSCAKAGFTEYNRYDPHSIIVYTPKTDDSVSISSDGKEDDDNDSLDYGSLWCKVEQGNPKKDEVIIIDSDEDDDSCDQNHCLIGIYDFENKFWSACVKKIDPNCNSTEELEKKNMIREDSTHFGSRYGRTKFEACQKIFERTNLKKDEIFIDIGHGIGNAVLQAALTIGCNSRGLELNLDRFLLSKEIQKGAKEFLDQERSIVSGKIDLRHGDFCDKKQIPFIVGADVALVNNAMEIFSGRSQAPVNGPSLDDHIAGLFARMKPGARMVTFTALPLGLSLTEANHKLRKWKRNNYFYDSDASFFECETFSIGKDCVSWTKNEIIVYMYTRVKNSSNTQAPMFICQKCGFKDSVLSENTNLLIKTCSLCNIKRPVTGVREAAKGVQYHEDMISNSDD